MATAPPAPKALATSGEQGGDHAGGTVSLHDQVRDALAAAGLATSELRVTRADGPSDASSVSVVGDGHDFVVHAAPATESRRYFRRRDELVAWYSTTSRDAPPLNVLETACDALLAAVASMPRPHDRSLPDRLTLPHRSLLDAVRCGVKPAASMLVDLKRFDPGTLGNDLAYVLSVQGFDTSETGDIRIDWNPARDEGRRMLYVGLDRSALVEMRDTEAELYATRDGSGSGYTGTLQRRFGEAMGYPACCTGAFVARLDQGNRAADYYTAVGTLGAGEAPTPWWENHVVAHALRLPFLLHEPRTTRCEETRAGVERAIEALYDANERPLIRRALSMGAVIWPDDTMLLFEPASALQDNAVSVCSLRPPTSGNAVELAPPVSLPEVSGVRIIDDALELHADGQRHIWRRSAGPPRLVVPESAPEHG